MPVRRYDSSQPRRKPELQANGFLKADAVLARTGVQTYRLGDNTTRRELRLPEEVFNADSMASFQLLPVTDDHPPVMVTAENATKFARGAVGTDIRQDGDLLCASVMITDKALVQKVLDGSKEQLSNGYDCDLEMKPGVHPQFGPYDAIQRNIVGNHLAVVKYARAGPVARVRMDATDGELVDDSTEQPVQPNPNSPVQPGSEPPARRATMDKITIDGFECTTPEQVREVSARRDARIAAEHKATQDAIAKARADAETALAATKAELEKLKGHADGLKADLDKATKAKTDAEDPKRIAAAVTARVAIETKAQRVLGKDAKLDGLDEPAINALMLKKLQPELNLDGKSADYVLGCLDRELSKHDAANPTPESLRAEVEQQEKARRDAGEPGTDKGRVDHLKKLDSLAKDYRSPMTSRAAPTTTAK